MLTALGLLPGCNHAIPAVRRADRDPGAYPGLQRRGCDSVVGATRPRTAAGSTALRYHFHRVQSTQDLTAQKARELLRDADVHGPQVDVAHRGAGNFRDNGPHGTARVEARPSDSGLDAFSEADWLIMNRLAGNRIAKDFGDKAKKSCLKALRTRVAKALRTPRRRVRFLPSL